MTNTFAKGSWAKDGHGGEGIQVSKSGKSVVEPGHEIWDREWRKHNHKLHLNPNQKVVDVIRECFNDQLKHKKILELGAGSGSDIIYLAQNGAE